MPEIVRTIVTRFRDFVGNRSRARRLSAHLPLSVSLQSHGTNGANRQPSTLNGHTRDVSRTGLSLVLPSLRLGNRHLIEGYRSLRISCQLPSGTVKLAVSPVRCEQLGNGTFYEGYLVGAHITEITGSDKERFVQYLNTLH
jgi:hypothetical protein